MSGRVRGQGFLTDISSLVTRVRTLELVTFGETDSTPSVQESILVGSISVPVSSTLSASAAAFVPVAQSVSAPESVSTTDPVSAGDRQVYITPLADRLRGGAPSASEQTSEAETMVIIKTADQFLLRWAALPEEERAAFEQEHASNPEQVVVNEAMKKLFLRQQHTMTLMAQQLAASQAEAVAARAAADAAIAAQAQQAAQVNNSEPAMKPKPPPSFENKEKDLPMAKWLPVVENYLSGCPDKDYLKMASSLLNGKPRSFWQSKYDLRLKEGPPIVNPPEFFREVMMSGYGLKDETQQYWDTWNKLRQKPGEDISEYNIAFETARTDLIEEVQGEQVLIEKYKSGLQKDIRELARVSPSGKRWTSLKDLVEYCTLQWPTIQARLDKSSGKALNPNNKSPSVKVGGKRKAMSPNRPDRSNQASSSGAKNSGKFRRLSDEQKAKNIRDNLCHICSSPDHFSKSCPDRTVAWKDKKGNKKKDFA